MWDFCKIIFNCTYKWLLYSFSISVRIYKIFDKTTDRTVLLLSFKTELLEKMLRFTVPRPKTYTILTGGYRICDIMLEIKSLLKPIVLHYNLADKDFALIEGRKWSFCVSNPLPVDCPRSLWPLPGASRWGQVKLHVCCGIRNGCETWQDPNGSQSTAIPSGMCLLTSLVGNRPIGG